jgi:hypothetical protein
MQPKTNTNDKKRHTKCFLYSSASIKNNVVEIDKSRKATV